MAADTKPRDPVEEQRKIRAVKKMKEIMTAYFIDAKTAAQNNKTVAWIASGGPVEPLIAMDVIPVYPENHSAMIGASHMAVDLCQVAEGMGFSRDLCSYARADIAAAATNGGPIGGLPRPDFLVCCNNICGTVMKWYESLARFFSVPLFIYDTPFIHTDFSDEARRYVRTQTDEYIRFIEEQTGRTMDYDRLRQVARLSIQAMRLWQEVLETCAHRPAPMTAFDAFFFLALIVTLRGTTVVVDYYTELLAELKERIAAGIGMVPVERHRLLWDNLPVWYKTRWLSETFAAHDAALVACTYTNAWCSVAHLVDENDLMGSLGVASSSIYINISIDRMLDQLGELIDKYQIDGIVMHSNRSCKPYSFGQYDLQRLVQKRFGIPSLILEADMLDERSFSESQIRTRIDAFIEILNSTSGKGA